jgi:cellulose biosynthesis protein BcsQ
MRATLSLNLAAAMSRLGHRVALCDPDGLLRHALGAAASEHEVVLPGRAAGSFALVASPDDARAAACDVVVAHAAPSADDPALASARLLLVPLDASPAAAQVLREVGVLAAALRPVPRVRAVLARTLPRGVDRWSLVERLEDEMPGALYGNTIPMTRRADLAPVGGVPRSAPRIALLYGGGTRASRAYESLASEALADLA